MELLRTLLEPRKLSSTSVDNYCRYIGYLANKYEPEHKYINNAFLTTYYTEILEYLMTLQPASRRAHLAAICVCLSPSGRNLPSHQDQGAYDLYRPMVWCLNEEYTASKKTQTLSVKEKANWCDWSELTDIRDGYGTELRKLGYKQSSTVEEKKGDLLLIKKYLVAGLYTYNPPRRLEYAEMSRITYVDYNKLDREVRQSNNYCVSKSMKKNKFFSFAKVKSTDPDEPVVKIDVDPELNKIINMWYSMTPGKTPFLLNPLGEAFSKNNLSKFLDIKVFKPTGKKISTNMLRHIYLSNVYSQDKAIVFKEELAKKMNHSVKTMEYVYVKKLPEIQIIAQQAQQAQLEAPETPPNTPVNIPEIVRNISLNTSGVLVDFN